MCNSVNIYSETGKCFPVISCKYTLIILYEIDATIVMRCRIEKRNYNLITGFTMYQAQPGENRSFLLDTIIVLNVNDLEYM